MKNSNRSSRLSTVLLLVAAALVASGYLMASAACTWLAIDRCLDRGGRWSEAKQTCEDA